ncbi:MAG: hypothetical protein WAM14_26395, partial [Candidatus Nitrosopolaris sp.]
MTEFGFANYMRLGHNSMFSFCQFPLIIWYKASLVVSNVLVKNDQIHPEKAGRDKKTLSMAKESTSNTEKKIIPFAFRSYSVNVSAIYKNTFKHLFPYTSLSSDVVNKLECLCISLE